MVCMRDAIAIMAQEFQYLLTGVRQTPIRFLQVVELLKVAVPFVAAIESHALKEGAGVGFSIVAVRIDQFILPLAAQTETAPGANTTEPARRLTAEDGIELRERQIRSLNVFIE